MARFKDKGLIKEDDPILKDGWTTRTVIVQKMDNLNRPDFRIETPTHYT